MCTFAEEAETFWDNKGYLVEICAHLLARVEHFIKNEYEFCCFENRIFSYWLPKHRKRKTILFPLFPCSEIRHTFLELAIQWLYLFAAIPSSSLYYMPGIDISPNFYSSVGVAHLHTHPHLKKDRSAKCIVTIWFLSFCLSRTISRHPGQQRG